MRAKIQGSNELHLCLFVAEILQVKGSLLPRLRSSRLRMPLSKHRDCPANKQDITYTEVKTCKSTQKQRIPTAKQSPAVLREEQVNYAKLSFHRTLGPQPKKQVVRRKRQGTVVCPFCN